MGNATLTERELIEITGYTSPNQQLDVLHKRGFVRAFRSRKGNIILERPHYQAVCRGEFGSKDQSQARSLGVNLAFMKPA